MLCEFFDEVTPMLYIGLGKVTREIQLSMPFLNSIAIHMHLDLLVVSHICAIM